MSINVNACDYIMYIKISCLHNLLVYIVINAIAIFSKYFDNIVQFYQKTYTDYSILVFIWPKIHWSVLPVLSTCSMCSMLGFIICFDFEFKKSGNIRNILTGISVFVLQYFWQKFLMEYLLKNLCHCICLVFWNSDFNAKISLW